MAVQIFNVYTSTSTSFTVPAGVTRIFVEACGGGGGGGGGYHGGTASSFPFGGGGGGSAVPQGVLLDVTPGESITINVGAGGSAGSGGVGSLVTAPTSGGNGGSTEITGSFGTVTFSAARGGGAYDTSLGLAPGGGSTGNAPGTPKYPGNGGASYLMTAHEFQGCEQTFWPLASYGRRAVSPAGHVLSADRPVDGTNSFGGNPAGAGGCGAPSWFAGSTTSSTAVAGNRGGNGGTPTNASTNQAGSAGSADSGASYPRNGAGGGGGGAGSQQNSGTDVNGGDGAAGQPGRVQIFCFV